MFSSQKTHGDDQILRAQALMEQNLADLFHGSPRSHTEDLLATTVPDQVDEALGPSPRTIMAGGHTHLQLLRQHRGILMVNPGSLGLPFQSYAHRGPPRILPYAEYAIAEAAGGSVAVTLCRPPLDRGALLAALDNWDNPLRGYLQQQYLS